MSEEKLSTWGRIVRVTKYITGIIAFVLIVSTVSDRYFGTHFYEKIVKKAPILDQMFGQGEEELARADKTDPYFIELDQVIEQIAPKQSIKDIKVKKDHETQKTFFISTLSGNIENVIVTLSGGKYNVKREMRK